MSQIKSRLRTAYENVEFYANSTWVHSSRIYQRANQELYIRECKVRDAMLEEPSRPRTVRDNISQSRLAQYGNYEYNEARELCYASSLSDIFFYYPCMYKRNSIREPWMIPEVEQLFIWFSYAPDFNILEVLRQEELNHVDEQEKLEINRRYPSCCWHDFHHVYPAFYETLERTPGRPRYTNSPAITEEDMSKFSPSHVKTQTFEEMILQMRIKSDNVRYLWNAYSWPNSDQQHCNQTQTSSSDNNPLLKEDFKELHYLTEFIRSLESILSDETNQTVDTSFPQKSIHDNSENEIEKLPPKTEILTTRRLYSAVVQGITTTPVSEKKSASSTDVTPQSSTSTKETLSLSISSTSPTKIENSSFTPLLSTNKSTSMLQASNWSQASWDTSNTESKPNNDTISTSQQKIEPISCPFNPTPACYPSDTCPYNTTPANSKNTPPLPPSHPLSLGINLYVNNNVCYNNVYGNNNCINNSYQSVTNYQNNFYINNSYSTRNVVPQLNNRQPYQANQSMWIVQHNRPPAVYTFAHFASQPYFLSPPPPPPPPPPSRANKRWTPQTHYYNRPPQSTFHSYHLPPPSPPQQWSVQNQNASRTNSNQHFFENSLDQSVWAIKMRPKKGQVYRKRCKSSPDRGSFDETEMSSKKSSSSPQITFAADKEHLIKSAASLSSVKHKTSEETSFGEPYQSSLEFFPRNRYENLRFFSHTLPVTETVSEELERQALEQYQASDDNFYQELEREAEEQYEGDQSENLNCPPNENNIFLFGGLMTISKFISITKNCLLIIFLIYFDMDICNHVLFLFS